MPQVLLILLAFVSLGVRAICGDKSPGTTTVDFTREIQPILESRCLSCHGPDMQESGFRVDLRQSLQSGGDSETPAIVPKHSGKSLLIERVTSVDPESLMPPEGKPLTKTEIALLKTWIDTGANMPERFEQIKRTASDHWSFRPLEQVQVPNGGLDGVDNPIDAFVLWRLREVELSPAPLADRKTLLRRVMFDLTGLPPTPEELKEFEDDARPDAYERLIDRLLASPAYGERWGRHWLDVVRYADSNGLDENVAHGNAWRYRDYVVASLNADKSYAKFVQEQLAGDLLPRDQAGQPNEQLIATGFLSLGPKVLAEVDETKMEMDIVDEQIDTFGKAFLGLTFGCARCHDHKFDPVTTEDYYALAGIFRSTRTMDSFKKIAKWHEHEIATEADRKQKSLYDRRRKSKTDEIAEFVKLANKALLAAMQTDAKLPAKPEEHYPAETKERLKTLREELAEIEKSVPVIPTAMGAIEGEIANVPVHQRGSHLSLGKEVPRRFPEVLKLSGQSNIPAKSSGRLQLAQWLTNPSHPLTARVMVNRVWRWHFGRGLVDSTDNFGELGADPSHPALLDWLAGRLIESNWSLKDLHRLIVTSRTYRQDSAGNSSEAQRHLVQQVDPENRFLWRANVRRLEAEAIRDALLTVSGSIDRKMGGSVLNTDNRKHVFDHTSKDNTSYDFPVRSVYLPIVRNNLYDLFQLFDYTDASTVNGNRTTSTVAPQALFLMNADLVAQASSEFAANLLAETASDDLRITSMYQRALGREPSQLELNRGQNFLKQMRESLAASKTLETGTAEQQAWSMLCQVLLVSNEFITIR